MNGYFSCTVNTPTLIRALLLAVDELLVEILEKLREDQAEFGVCEARCRIKQQQLTLESGFVGAPFDHIKSVAKRTAILTGN
jgi:hypothetical protein